MEEKNKEGEKEQADDELARSESFGSDRRFALGRGGPGMSGPEPSTAQIPGCSVRDA